MSGPSLKKPEAHTSIHEAALGEAIELNDMIRTCFEKGDSERASQIAEIAIEHWETRTLRHAEAEEEGLYKEAVIEKPELADVVSHLKRDHDLMRRIVGQIKKSLLSEAVDARTVLLLESLIIIDEIHNEDEMNKLLSNF